MFYWVSREKMSGSFHDMLDTYVHEAAHKEGPHGQAKFEYFIEQCKKKITEFIKDHREEWDELEKSWSSLEKNK